MIEGNLLLLKITLNCKDQRERISKAFTQNLRKRKKCKLEVKFTL